MTVATRMVYEIAWRARREASPFILPLRVMSRLGSYQCLTDLHYLYSVDQHWSPDAYRSASFVNLADPTAGVRWPIPLTEALLSQRDRDHPMLSELRRSRSRSWPAR